LIKICARRRISRILVGEANTPGSPAHGVKPDGNAKATRHDVAEADARHRFTGGWGGHSITAPPIDYLVGVVGIIARTLI